MRLTYENFGLVVPGDMHAAIEALGIAKFTGVSVSGGDLHIEFPGRTSLTSSQRAAIDQAVADYIYTPPAEV